VLSDSAGLGHMGRQIRARSRKAHVVLFHHIAQQEEDALRLGADEVVVSRNAFTRWPKPRGQLRTSFWTPSPPITTSTRILNLLPPRTANLCLVGGNRKTVVCRCLRSSLRPPQPVRVRHRRHRRDSGDARLLWQTQHHRRIEVIPHPESNELTGQAFLKADVKIPFRHRAWRRLKNRNH